MMAVAASAVLIVGGSLVFPWAQSPPVHIAALLQSLDAAPPAPAQPAPVTPPVAVVAAPGRVEPATPPVELAFAAVGRLRAVYVSGGDKIHRGELLAELDNADQQARTREAAASVVLRQAELDKLQNGARAEERNEAAARLDEANANLAYARREFERRMPLAQTGAASRQSLDQAQSALRQAEARQSAAAAAATLINAPPRPEDVAIAKATLALAQAKLAEQQALLEQTQLRSPFDGVVLRRYLRPGEAIGAIQPTPVLEVGDTSRLRVRAEIDQTDIARVAAGDRVWVTADAYPGRRFGGVIARLGERVGRKTVHTDDPTAKTDTQVLDALIDLDPGVHLPVGLRVDVTIKPAGIARN
jgi:HlyD family secretion protein